MVSQHGWCLEIIELASVPEEAVFGQDGHPHLSELMFADNAFVLLLHL